MDISRHVTNDLIELFIVTAAVIGAILSSDLFPVPWYL